MSRSSRMLYVENLPGDIWEREVENLPGLNFAYVKVCHLIIEYVIRSNHIKHKSDVPKINI